MRQRTAEPDASNKICKVKVQCSPVRNGISLNARQFAQPGPHKAAFKRAYTLKFPKNLNNFLKQNKSLGV